MEALEEIQGVHLRNQTNHNGGSSKVAPAPKNATASGAPIVAVLRVQNVAGACSFYGKLGFVCERTVGGPGGEPVWAQLRFGRQRFLLLDLGIPTDNYARNQAEETHPLGLGVSLYVNTPNVEKVYQAFTRMGCVPETRVHEEFWGDQTFSVADPFGYHWTFAKRVRTVPLQKPLMVQLH